jgi:hypothetical protein
MAPLMNLTLAVIKAILSPLQALLT